MRDSFGNDIFAKSLHYTGRNPYLVFPFGHSLKLNTGLNNRHAYQFTYSNLSKIWNQHQNFSDYARWPVKQTRTFTNYTLPVKIGNNFMLAQKWSLAHTRRFVLIDREGQEINQITIGSNNAGRISVNQGRIAWSENKTDLRWTNRTYSEVMIFDMATQKQKVLTRKTWYFSPAFSPNGNHIAVIEETPQYQSYLVDSRYLPPEKQ
ncbi:MAG: hypothetical protein HC830_13285 [Bacteroidetes bacterium]|nr:hypothetical protein [Bacteroidota bacterium]